MFKPWLAFPPQLAHDLAPLALKTISKWKSGKPHEWKSFEWKGIHFPNPLGIAGGVDKNGFNTEDWWKWGVGFQEIGTVTLRPQNPNPPPLIMRDTANYALWNKLGFPNEGSEKVLKRISALPKKYPSPVFVNIGKQRSTANEEANKEYIKLIKIFESRADAFVINISSPNTKGLRDLLSRENLSSFLSPILESNAKTNHQRPILLKLSPDMDEETLSNGIETSLKAGVDGWVLTNTTTFRSSKSPFPSEGGVSGRPLREKSLSALKVANRVLGDRRSEKLLISVGGVMSSADVFERLTLGADLIQAYSAIVFQGPGFFNKVAKDSVDL